MRAVMMAATLAVFVSAAYTPAALTQESGQAEQDADTEAAKQSSGEATPEPSPADSGSDDLDEIFSLVGAESEESSDKNGSEAEPAVRSREGTRAHR